MACTVCIAGYACPSTTSSTMTPCPSGYYSIGGQSSCTLCPSGSYCPSRTSAPLDCPMGTYSTAGQVICTISPPGYFVSSPKSSYPTRCGVGYFSSGGAVTCTLCDPGYYCPSGSTEPAPPSAACAIGGYCNPADTYTPCPVGTYGIVSAGTSLQQACTSCDPGVFFNFCFLLFVCIL
jgi:hypothetical protein